MKRVFECIDFKKKGYINGRAVLKFAMSAASSGTVYIPKVCLSLVSGKHYRRTIMQMSKKADTNNDGVVDLLEFTNWALDEWKPRLPNTEIARSAVDARKNDT